MICVRCDRHILPGEDYDSQYVESASSGDRKIDRHTVCPPAKTRYDRAPSPNLVRERRG